MSRASEGMVRGRSRRILRSWRHSRRMLCDVLFSPQEAGGVNEISSPVYQKEVVGNQHPQTNQAERSQKRLPINDVNMRI